MPSDHLFRRGGVWYCWVYLPDGSRLRRSTKQTDRRAATRVLRRLERTAQGAARLPVDAPHAALEEALGYLIEHSPDVAEATRQIYEQKAGHLARLLGADKQVNRLHRDDVAGYIQKRLAENAATATVHKELGTLHKALELAKARGIFVGQVDELFPDFKVDYHPRERWLTEREFHRLLAHLTPPHQLWVILAVYTGARMSEIEALTWSRLDLQGGWVLLPGRKTKGSWRQVPISPILREVLRRAPTTSEKVVPRWQNVHRSLLLACQRARIDPVSPNDLRRTFASWLAQAGVPLKVIAELLGHASTRMVELVYGHLAKESLRGAVARLPGRWDAGGTESSGPGEQGERDGQPETEPTPGNSSGRSRDRTGDGRLVRATDKPGKVSMLHVKRRLQ